MTTAPTPPTVRADAPNPIPPPPPPHFLAFFGGYMPRRTQSRHRGYIFDPRETTPRKTHLNALYGGMPFALFPPSTRKNGRRPIRRPRTIPKPEPESARPPLDAFVAQFNVIAKRFNTLIARHRHKKGGKGGDGEWTE